MANPLNGLFQAQPQPQSNPALQSFQRMAQMLRTSQNPRALEMLAQQNPLMAQIMNLCSGKDPKEMFIAECKNRGIDPDQAMSMLGLK